MRTARKIFFVLLILLLILLVILMIKSAWTSLANVIRLVLLGAAFAYVLLPVCQWLEKYVPRAIAIIILIILIIATIGIFIFLIIPKFFNELKSAAEKLPAFVEAVKSTVVKIQDGFEKMGLPEKVRQATTDYFKVLGEKLTNQISKTINGLIKKLAHLPDLILVPVLGFYFLKDREYFSKLLVNSIPKVYRNNILRICQEINVILHQFIRGQIFITIVVSIMSVIGYLLVGLPYAMVLGIFMGIMEIIPYFGPWLGAIPVILIAAVQGPAKLLWAVIVVLIIQQLEGGIITPKILSNEVNLHPVYVILSIWLGGSLFGLLGMLVAVPVVLVLRIIFKYIIISIVSRK